MSARVDTQLSQHLIQHGLLAADSLESALQKQLTHGGALDTILLETGELDEARLSDALAEAWGTGSLSVERVSRPDPRAAKRLPARMAMNLGLCPLFVDDAGVHVATRGPLDRELIREVAELIGATLIPHVVPEVRLFQALAAAYDLPPAERMVSLMTRLELNRTGRSPPRILSAEEVATELTSAEESPTEDWDLVEALAHLVAQENRTGIAEVVVGYARRFLPFAAVFGIRDGNAIGWQRSGPCEGAQFEVPLPIPEDSILAQIVTNPSPFIGKPPISDGNAVVFGWLGRRRPWTALLIPIVVAGRTVGALYGDGGVRSRDFESLSDLVAFGARVGPAFEALLRARHRARGDAAPRDGRDGTSPFARGYVAPAPSPLPEDGDSGSGPTWTAEARFVPTSLSAAPAGEHEEEEENNQAEHSDDDFDMEVEDDLETGPLSDEDEPADEPEPVEPEPAEPEPVQAEPVEAGADETDFGDLNLEDDGEGEGAALDDNARSVEEALAAAAAQAQAYLDAENFDDELDALDAPAPEPAQAPAPEPEVDLDVEEIEIEEIEDEEVEDEAIEATEPEPALALVAGVEIVDEGPVPELLRADGWEDVALDEAYLDALVDEPAPAAPASERIERVTAPPIPPSEWVERLYARKTETAARAIDALVAFGEGALPTLNRVFPGRLRADPFGTGPEPVAALQLGPVVEVLARMGELGLEVAERHVESRSRTSRYVATYLYSLNGDERCIRVLRPRLHDAEPRIQELAARALSRFVASPEFEPEILAHLRARLDSPVFDARERAIRLLGLFRDPRAVPTLVQQLEDKSGELEQQALGALRLITLRDFGPRPRPWRRWWTKAKHRPRIEWLLEGLRSKSEDLRRAAFQELVELTGDELGYDPAARRGARDRAAARFDAWWENQRKTIYGAG